MRARGRVKGLGNDDRGDSVLKNQLLLVVRLEHNRIFVEAFDAARKLYAAHQVNRQEDLVLPCIIQKSFLDVLRQLFHGRGPLAGLWLVFLNGSPSTPRDRGGYSHDSATARRFISIRPLPWRPSP